MNKACPVVLRKVNDEIEILVFSHPLAGNQLVKGTIERSELLEQACVRELEEESGLSARPLELLGEWESGFDSQVWGFYLMEYSEPLPDSWEYLTKDDGGHLFQFFWQPLHAELEGSWHSLFVGALSFIKQALSKVSI